MGIFLRRYSPVFTGRVALALLFLGVVALSSWRTELKATGTVTVTTFSIALMIAYLYLVIVQDVPKLRLLMVVIVLSLGLEGAKQGWVRAIFSPGSANSNRVAILGDNNLVGLGMLMLVPLTAALARTAKNVWWRRWFAFLAVGILYRAITTYSRGALLALAGLGFIWWIRSKYKLRAAVFVVIGIAVILPTMPDTWWNKMETIFTAREENEKSAMSRLHFWKTAVQIANDHPVIGVGIDGFRLHYDAYDSEYGFYGNRRAVHSTWFGVVSETGYLGLMLFVLIIASAFRTCWRIRRMARQDPRYEELGAYATGLEGAFVAFVIGGTFVNFHYNEMLWSFLGLTFLLDHFVRTKSPESLLGPVKAAETLADAGEPSNEADRRLPAVLPG